MHRINKPASSDILAKKLNYKDGGGNRKLSKVLCEEQHNVCAYTETYLGRADKKDIEHFNPTLKNTAEDCHENWFLVKAQWNSEKGRKWEFYQPILYPTAVDFEKRIIYFDGEHNASTSIDEEALNLIQLLKSDDSVLTDTRKQYINRIKNTISASHKQPQQFVDNLLVEVSDAIYFIRTLETELAVTVNFTLLTTK